MTVTDVAFGSRWPRSPLPRWATPFLALTLSVAGLVALTLAFAGPSTYEDVARANGFERVPFLVPANVSVERRQLVRYDVATRVSLHQQTVRYVLGEEPGTARDPTTRDPLFTFDEQKHLADVRDVFGAARAIAIVAGAFAVVLLIAVGLRGRVILARVIRGSAGLGAIGVAVIGLIAAVAFEPAFLAFHYLFFPQGNFLFDPATSNLLALYPEVYWYAVTLRIGGTFIGAAVAVVIVTTIALRARTAR